MVVLAACSTSAADGPVNAGEAVDQNLTVFAGSSLTEAFRELANVFQEQHPGASVVFNFAGSQRLRTQLEHGASADVFASADWKQMTNLVESGLVSGDPVSFASNQLVVIAPSPRRRQNGVILPASGDRSDMRVSRLEDLALPGIKLVLASAEVPAGAYSLTVIERMNGEPRFGPRYAEKVLANLVSAETNVRNVVQKVALGEADAGLVYRSDAMVSEIVQRVEVIPIPAVFNVTANYPVAVMKEAKVPGLAQDFVRFLQSETAQRILGRRGFGPPDLLRADLPPADLLPADPLPGTNSDTRGRRDR